MVTSWPPNMGRRSEFQLPAIFIFSPVAWASWPYTYGEVSGKILPLVRLKVDSVHVTGWPNIQHRRVWRTWFDESSSLLHLLSPCHRIDQTKSSQLNLKKFDYSPLNSGRVSSQEATSLSVFKNTTFPLWCVHLDLGAISNWHQYCSPDLHSK